MPILSPGKHWHDIFFWQSLEFLTEYAQIKTLKSSEKKILMRVQISLSTGCDVEACTLGKIHYIIRMKYFFHYMDYFFNIKVFCSYPVHRPEYSKNSK